MAKLNIIEYLISKDKLSNIAVNQTSYERIIFAEKELKKTIIKKKRREYQTKYRAINKDKLLKIKLAKKAQDPDYYKKLRKNYYIKNHKKEKQQAINRYYENREESIARGWFFKFRTFRFKITRKLLLYSLYYIVNYAKTH